MNWFISKIIGLVLIVAGIVLEVMWVSFLFGSVLGVVLLLIFAPGWFFAPLGITTMGIGFLFIDKEKSEISESLSLQHEGPYTKGRSAEVLIKILKVAVVLFSLFLVVIGTILVYQYYEESKEVAGNASDPRSYAQTKYGVLEIKSIGEDYEKRLLLGSKVLFKEKVDYLFIKKVFHVGDSEIALICMSDGGSGTIADYFFINLMPNSPPVLSERFYSITNITINPIQKGDKITVDLGYNDGVYEVLTYQNGKQSIEKIEAKDMSKAADEVSCEYLYNMYVGYAKTRKCDESPEASSMAATRSYDSISHDPHFDLIWFQDISKASCERGEWIKYDEFKKSVCKVL